ncbi:MAG TPA: hypothetical protein VGG22_09750 [Candidatus Baltobacteraceae bacterium]|jgi:hypothetical protein
MISAAKQPSYRTPAFALSIALHLCVLGLVAALIPLWHITVNGYGLRDVAAICASPCGRVFAIRIERRARAAATEGIKRITETIMPKVASQTVIAQRPIRSYRATSTSHHLAPEHAAAVKAQLSTSGLEGTNPNVSIAMPATQTDVAASRLQPNTISANPSSADKPPVSQTRSVESQTGPANWGSHFDKPVLLDRTLNDDVLAKLPKGGKISIAVDDSGHATAVRIDAPGLDPAIIADLRARLLAARYATVERDGIAFEGTLIISSSQAR